MPTFEIPDGPTTIEAPRSGDPKSAQAAEASAAYSVTNTSSEGVVGRLGVRVAGSSQDQWFAIDGERERTFDAGETQTATVRVRFPPDAAAGDYPFRLRVVAVNDPDNDHADGPMTTARLAAGPPIAPPSRLWLWILLAVLALLAVAAGLWFALRPEKEVAKPPEAAAPAPVPELGTSQALQLAEKKTAAWAAAFSARDLDALAAMSAPPFFIDEGAILLDAPGIRDKYEARLVPDPSETPDPTEQDEPVQFDRIAPQLISQIKRSADHSKPEFDRIMRG
jgi:hypothetical protein